MGQLEDRIHIEDEALKQLVDALKDQGENYKSDLVKLQCVIDQINAGDFEGEPADDFNVKYEDKKPDFKALADEITRAEEYAGIKTSDFATMLANYKQTVK